MKTEVLIIGAGPTGLVLALWLTKTGISVRIIDKEAKPRETSRAVVFHARNLEFYRQMGIDELFTKEGIEFRSANLWVRGKRVGRAPFADMGKGISKYPYALIIPQDVQEKMLAEQLVKLNVNIERNVGLVSFTSSADGVTAQLQKQDGTTETCEAKYLAGCDGAKSMIRETLNIEFPGGTYSDTFYVADVNCSGEVANKEMHISLDSADFLAVFPMKGDGNVRLVGSVQQSAKEQHDLQWKDVSHDIVQRTGINVKEIKWFSTYRVHHRVAQQFRKGNVFILGDAAHLHSPVGGQGMNTGIGDAVNLAWKLEAVLKRQSPVSILDTYETERIDFAKKLVSTTDRVFTFANSKGPLARFVRLNIIPRVVPKLFKRAFVRRFMYKTLSQTSINYPHSALSSGSAGEVHGGDRLPWIITENNNDNYTPLTSMQWQVHCYGTASAGLQAICSKRKLKLEVFPFNAAAKEKGVKENAAYVIRPDGYVGLAEQNAAPAAIAAYLDQWVINA